MTAGRPFLPLYTAEFFDEIAGMDTRSVGAYTLLLTHYWRHGGPLPDADLVLRQITRLSPYLWTRARKIFAKIFTLSDGVWRHARLDQLLERTRKNDVTEARASRARAAEIPEIHKETSQAMPGAAPGRVPPAAGSSSIFEEGIAILGRASAGLVRLMLRTAGDDRVREALRRTENDRPRSPRGYFRFLCDGSSGHARAPPPSTSTGPKGPPPTLEEMQAAIAKQEADAAARGPPMGRAA